MDNKIIDKLREIEYALLFRKYDTYSYNSLFDCIEPQNESEPTTLTVEKIYAMVDKVNALPPPIVAVKCHPMQRVWVEKTMRDILGNPNSLFGWPDIYTDENMLWGQFLTTTDRAIADEWKRDAWRKYFVATLGRYYVHRVWQEADARKAESPCEAP